MTITTRLGDYSVLMSVYAKGNADYLDAAIQSMVNQTAPFHDMVLVCDGPLTFELDKCVEWWQHELGERLNVVHLPENGGLGKALNEGLSECGCDIVARMDADDISRRDRCEKLLEAMREGDLDLVGGAIEEFESVPGDLGTIRRLPEDRRMIERFAARRNPFNHMSVMFHRHVIEDAGGYQSFYLLEDYWLWARLLSRGCECANISDVVVDVRVGEGMYARRGGLRYLKSQLRLLSEMRRLGISNRRDVIITVIARATASIIPERANRYLYQHVLRKRDDLRIPADAISSRAML